jgi:uncharacterized protein (DUF1697 family)
MQTYIILLRGVMPVGKNKIPMAQLRQILADAGYESVRTYIASGNVLLESSAPASAIATNVRKLIKTHIGPDLVIIVKTGQEIQSLLERNPFAVGHDPSRLFFVLFENTPDAKLIAETQARDYGDEKLALFDDGAVLYIPGQYGRGLLSNNYLEKKLGISATMRNLNTLTKLVELSWTQDKTHSAPTDDHGSFAGVENY